MKKLFCLSFVAIGMAATMSAMNSPVPPAQKAISVITVSTNESAWPEPGNPNPPYDK
jgi:hypothetical protein